MNNSPFDRSKGAVAFNKYGVARGNLLLTVILTVINIVLSALNASVYLLFSASIPYIIASVGSGLMYDREFAAEMGATEEMIPVIFTVLLIVGLVLTVPYFLCWLFSKKHYGWMIAALVLFSLDTLFLLFNFDISLILDLLIHAWVLYYLIMGVVNGARFRKAEAEAAAAEQAVRESAEGIPPEDNGTSVNDTEAVSGSEDTDGTDSLYTIETPEVRDSLPLRSAEQAAAGGEKVSVYVETVYRDRLHIVYRRVGKTDELVVNDSVYAEMPRAKTNCHMTAVVDGVTIDAGVANSSNIIAADGVVLAHTVRWL